MPQKNVFIRRFLAKFISGIYICGIIMLLASACSFIFIVNMPTQEPFYFK